MNEEENIEEQSHELSASGGEPEEKPEGRSENLEVKENSIIPEPDPQLQTTSPTLQTENMEAHHPHHVTHKKKWTEYLLEFFMLFFAVFLGFIAENIREHIVENNREKQFMQSMVEDLEKDAFMMENESKKVMLQYAGLDSLTKIIYEGNLDRLQVRRMYQLQRKFLYPLNLKLINRTELQLTNSGGMRLIRNRQVTDSIIHYWSTTELLYETKESINLHRGKAKDMSFTLFNNKYYKHTKDFSLDSSLNPFMGDPELMTKSFAVLTEFANRVSHMTDLLKYNYKERSVDKQAENARNLIRLIKKEYHLINE
ncbi:MAG: hypothetical protein ABIW34_05710 [Ginsengibacter sp.]